MDGVTESHVVPAPSSTVSIRSTPGRDDTSLVNAPTDSSAGATARRLAVRQRTIDLNAVIAEECGAVLRCRTDDGRLFELSSNRIDPYANTEPGPGGYLPRNQWEFVDDDISFNRGTFSWLCPAPGVLSGGTVCGDHFHPSLEGQNKLAEGGHEASYQFGDNAFPDPSLVPQRALGGGNRQGPSERQGGLDGFGGPVHQLDVAQDALGADVGRQPLAAPLMRPQGGDEAPR